VNEAKLRIFMLLDRYLPVIGGSELQTSRLARTLQNRGHSIRIVTRRLTPDLQATEILDGIPVHRLSPIGLSHFANAVMVARVFLYLVTQSRNYDLVHVDGVGPLGLAALLAAKLTHKPVLLKVAAHGNLSRSDHAGIVPRRYSRFVRSILLPPSLWNWWLRQASAIIVLGRETAEEAAALGLSDRTVRIPNGVDTSVFRPLPPAMRMALRHKLGVADDERILLFTGRLVRGKGLITIAEAMPELAERMPSVQLWLAGSGTLQIDDVTEQLQQTAAKLRLSDRIRFLGPVAEVEKYLQAADLFVFPSQKEGMPNSVLEAMACGIPVISSDIEGVRDIADESLIWFFPVGDTSALVEAILCRVSDPEATMAAAERARERIETAFSLSAVTEQHEAVYKALASVNDARKPGSPKRKFRQH
jgi:glycosyltransferase involved in cell wall biosynthesis